LSNCEINVSVRKTIARPVNTFAPRVPRKMVDGPLARVAALQAEAAKLKDDLLILIEIEKILSNEQLESIDDMEAIAA